MHYTCEIVMPNVEDVHAAVEQIMAPFSEHDDDDEDSSGYKFWDYWVIGGRWSGRKLRHSLGQDRLDVFHKLLIDMKITVSSFVAGKEKLEPATQIPAVDALWRDYFPDSGLDVCPLFDHSGEQLNGDILPLEKMADDYTCSRIIFAAQKYNDSGMEAKHMAQDDFWNGVNYINSTWDGTFGAAMKEFNERIDSYSEEYKAKITPQPDWIVVTVDYHS